MLIDLTPLETIIYRAALALQFADAATGERVTEGMVVRAYAFDPADPQLARRFDTAESSPNSGVYGFRTLPGLERYQIGDPVAVGSLAFIVTIEDTVGRYLPQTHRYDLPFADPAVQIIELFSGPNRPAPTGYGVIRAQLLQTTTPTPPQVTVTGAADWARLVVNVPGGSPDFFHGFSNSRGTALMLVPYPLIPLAILLNEAEWTAAMQVEHETAALETDYLLLEQVIPDLDEEKTPPFQETLANQAAANLFGSVTIVDAASWIYDVVGPVNDTDLDFTLQFGRPLVLRTRNDAAPDEPLSELLLESA